MFGGILLNSIRVTMVGIFLLIGLCCVGYLTVKLGRMELFSNDGFNLMARFDSASGLRVGADIELCGVPVGKVVAITLDDTTGKTQAVVHMRFDKDYKLSDDSIASIKTAGLIGDKYVSISRGGSETLLEADGEMVDTESPVDLETLLGKYAFGGV
ncbi:MAG: outer membrane lipid asymmetry maintenance protein MlaD [Desulfovibrio sp.]|nr:outer membrane lipid asymmetry maintenance protein MlaD [Desulfovibrio sp.]